MFESCPGISRNSFPIFMQCILPRCGLASLAPNQRRKQNICNLPALVFFRARFTAKIDHTQPAFKRWNLDEEKRWNWVIKLGCDWLLCGVLQQGKVIFMVHQCCFIGFHRGRKLPKHHNLLFSSSIHLRRRGLFRLRFDLALNLWV